MMAGLKLDYLRALTDANALNHRLPSSRPSRPALNAKQGSLPPQGGMVDRSAAIQRRGGTL
jgi:hypothetical protein